MKVTLLHHTPLWVCARAIRTCWDSHDKSDTEFVSKCGNLVGVCGEKDKELINRVGNKNKHSSTLEHLRGIAEILNPCEDIYLALLGNSFIDVTGDRQKVVISYNMRALQNLKVDINFKVLLCPKEWLYLLEESE